MSDDNNIQTKSLYYPIAHTFDVNLHTGFMAPEPPPSRLPRQWETWEALLDDATPSKIQLGDKPNITENEKAASRTWRARVGESPLLPVTELNTPPLLRRAHLVLTFLLHFYVQSLPPNAEVRIPRSISLPLLRVSKTLDIPPVLTFSDTVLYNWQLKTLPTPPTPALDNVRSQTMFTGLIDEEEFYMCSARIELRGVEALELMRITMDETFIGDQLAVRRIAGYLRRMVEVINEMKGLMMDVRKSCDPDRYYNQVRPWFRGEDSDINKRKWVFEGVEEDPALRYPTDLSGPSAGQSSVVHVLDLFLGVNHQSVNPNQPSYMLRMQTYMPHNHRMFLNHLATHPRPLRSFVMESGDGGLHDAYNSAISALKEFRDSHMIIATLYILGPARRAANTHNKTTIEPSRTKEPLKGTGGTDLVKFLKDTRTTTTQTLLP